MIFENYSNEIFKNINDEYYIWLCEKVMSPDIYSSMSIVMHKLYRKPFYVTYQIMDKNRITDGLSLRSLFSQERNYDITDVNDSIQLELHDISTCSVLELMVALSIRIEDEYTKNYNYGNRVPNWFWYMLHSLGIDYDDETLMNVSNEILDLSIDRFINYKFEPDGRGGLFVSNRANVDMRECEIWKQAMIFITDNNY